MRKAFLALFAATTLFVTACGKEPVDTPIHEKNSIVILFENDVHCAIDGYAKIAALRDAIADTAWAALVSSGDYIQGQVAGAISQGMYIVDIMRSMHYDAVGLGNHEFDFGVPRLLELFNGFNAPVVSCNFADLQDNLFYNPYTIRTYGDRKVAFVGVVTPETEVASEWYAFHDENGQPLYTLHEHCYIAMVQDAVNAARSEGADYVVLLSHIGEDFSGSYQWSSNSLIAATRGIDAVLDAHTHNVVDTVIANRDGQPVLLANTGTMFANVGKLWIGPDGRMDITLIPTEQIGQSSPTVAAEVERVHQLVNDQVGQIVAHSDVPILITDGNGHRMVRKAETNAGDLVADAMRWMMNADIGLVNGGGIRVDLPAGDLSYGDFISFLPFDNYVWKIEVTGADILEMLRVSTAHLPDESGDFPQVSGLRFTANVADHTVTSVEVLQDNGNYVPINPSSTYTVGTFDYDVNNGGFGGVFAGSNVLTQTGFLYRDALIKYISEALSGTIGQQYAAPQGRITIIQ